MVPMPLTVALVVAIVGLTGLFIAGIAYAALEQAKSSSDLNPGPTSGPTIGIGAAVLVGWAALSFWLGARGTFASSAPTRVPVIAIGILVPVLAGLLALATSRRLQGLVRAIPLPGLIGAQFYRVAGVLFLIAYAQHRMPGQFALPAGLGDVAVGLAAPGVAYAVAKGLPSARSLAWIWNIAGIADLVIAVSMGFLTAPSVYQQLAFGNPNVLITRYPFVLIPVFAVPASLLLHAFSLWRLRTAAAPGRSTATTWRPGTSVPA